MGAKSGISAKQFWLQFMNGSAALYGKSSVYDRIRSQMVAQSRKRSPISIPYLNHRVKRAALESLLSFEGHAKTIRRKRDRHWHIVSQMDDEKRRKADCRVQSTTGRRFASDDSVFDIFGPLWENELSRTKTKSGINSIIDQVCEYYGLPKLLARKVKAVGFRQAPTLAQMLDVAHGNLDVFELPPEDWQDKRTLPNWVQLEFVVDNAGLSDICIDWPKRKVCRVSTMS